jgi:peptidyl-prolyl cis-trans isomerase C
MNRPLLPLTLLSLAALATLGACTQKAADAPKEDSIAVVDGRPISRNTFEQYAKGVAGKPVAELNAEQQAQILDSLVRGEVIAGAAEASGLAKRDETRAALALSRLSILQQATQQEFLKDQKPSDEELRAEYDLQVGQMEKTQYRASHILVPTEEAAKKLIEQLKAGGNFAQLAKANSTDTGSKDRGGDLDWFSPGAMTPPFAEAVRKLKKGDTTAEPVQTQFGYHVIRVTDTRESPAPAFEAVRDRLVQIVEGKKFKAHVDALLAKAKVEKTEPAAAATTPAPAAAPAK